ncbi:MAG: hypothetical protein K0V04_03450 [Deltaproteobacteria bacterium]|nr:hypothetical protein [Deltaproteobacteria bacterium]
MVLGDVASRSSSERRRGAPLGLLGLAAVAALVGAYLSDCIPGLGSGGEVGTPSTPAPTPVPVKDTPPPKDADAQGSARAVVAVVGEQCRHGETELAACADVCAELGPGSASTPVEIDATQGTHGSVEALRTCLTKAGYTDITTRSE